MPGIIPTLCMLFNILKVLDPKGLLLKSLTGIAGSKDELTWYDAERCAWRTLLKGTLCNVNQPQKVPFGVLPSLMRLRTMTESARWVLLWLAYTGDNSRYTALNQTTCAANQTSFHNLGFRCPAASSSIATARSADDCTCHVFCTLRFDKLR